MICSGCKQECDQMDVTLTMVDRGGGYDWHETFCTPRCAYEWWREMLANDYSTYIEPDLLVIVAQDMYDAFEGLSGVTDITPQRFRELCECWARLGHVLGDLDLTLHS